MARIPDYVTVVELPSGRRYEVRVETSGADGHRKQSKRRFRTLKEAIDYHSGITADRGRGTHVAPAQLTVQQAVEAWLAGQRIRPKTMSSYITNLRPLVDHLGAKPVQQVTKGDIEQMVAALRDGKSRMGTWNAPKKLKGKKTRTKWAASSINPCLARTRNVFDDLVHQGVLTRNAAALVKAIPKVKSDMQTLTAEQVSALLRATADEPLHIGWRLALMGLRRGEVLALAWDAVDFTANTLSISASRAPIAGGSATGDTKTKGSVRTLPMPADLATALRRERKRQKELRLALGTKWPNTGLVVVDAQGNPPHPDSFGKRWRKALENAGLPAVRLHDARHSCATLMHLDGVPIAVIAAWLGHSDAGFTLSVYGHSQDRALAAAAEQLGRITSKPDTM